MCILHLNHIKSLSKFLEHTFIKRQQAAGFNDKVKQPTEDELVVQIDFSENYQCMEQSEIQSAHWNNRQISFHSLYLVSRGWGH